MEPLFQAQIISFSRQLVYSLRNNLPLFSAVGVCLRHSYILVISYMFSLTTHINTRANKYLLNQTNPSQSNAYYRLIFLSDNKRCVVCCYQYNAHKHTHIVYACMCMCRGIGFCNSIPIVRERATRDRDGRWLHG